MDNRRIVKRFAWFPTYVYDRSSRGKIAWLETIFLHQEYDGSKWITLYAFDKDYYKLN